jgi:hypothetical protein
LKRWIDPTGMHPAIEAIGSFRIDRIGVQDQTAERRLDVSAGAAKTVVQIEMAERGIEVIAPEQTDDPAAQPNAFWIAGRSIENALGFGEFVDFLGFFGSVGGRRGLLIRRLRFGGLGRRYRYNGNDTGEGETNRNAKTAGKLKHSMGHGSLDCWARSSRKKGTFPQNVLWPPPRPRGPTAVAGAAFGHRIKPLLRQPFPELAGEDNSLTLPFCPAYRVPRQPKLGIFCA